MKSAVIFVIAGLLAPFPVVGQQTPRPPLPRNEASWIQGDHYPAAALQAHAEGRVAFVLTVDPKGRPSGCRVTETSGNADLDSATCNLFRKSGRFYPAVDEGGNPVIGEWSSAMKWTLPR